MYIYIYKYYRGFFFFIKLKIHFIVRINQFNYLQYESNDFYFFFILRNYFVANIKLLQIQKCECFLIKSHEIYLNIRIVLLRNVIVIIQYDIILAMNYFITLRINYIV